MKVYRKIWEEAYGPIPVDEQGRSYEIHHIDGDRRNNALANLKCVSIVEHYLIHLSQGDSLAAAAVARRMGLDAETKSRLSSLAGMEARDRGLGFHGLTEEERFVNSSLGGKASKGLRWYNNGRENTRSRYCPVGWMPGKLPCGSGHKVGTKLGVFWNKDGVNKRADKCPGDGWIRGKFLTEEQRLRRSEIASRTGRKWRKKSENL